MKKIKTIFLLLCGIGLFLGSCEDNRQEYQEDYQTSIYFRNGGDQTLKFYRDGENTVYEIPICKGGLDRNATGVVTVLAMEQSQLDMYNLENETGYRQLPDSCFRFLTDQEFVFGHKEDSKVMRIELLTDKISVLQEKDPENEYVLALQVRANRTVSPDINLLILHLDINVPYLSLGTAGMVSDSYKNASPIEKTYANRVVLEMDSHWDFSCKLAVRDQEWLDAYNKKKGTEYKLLPVANYSLPDSAFFTTGSNSATFEVSVNRQNMEAFQEYVVPVYIASCSKPQFMLNEEEETSTMVLNVRQDPDIPLTADMLESPFTQANDGQGMEALVDGEASAESWWHSNYSSVAGDTEYGHYIDITLASPLSDIVLAYNVRAYNNGAPTHIVVGVSNDGENFTEIGRITEGLDVNGLSYNRLPRFSSETSFKIIRFGIAVSRAGDIRQNVAQETKHFTALSELELYGVNLVD